MYRETEGRRGTRKSGGGAECWEQIATMDSRPNDGGKREGGTLYACMDICNGGYAGYKEGLFGF